MQTRFTRFLENFILFAIILVLIQTFLEDFSVLAGWSWDIRRILIITGFGFDLLFTAEFFSRAISSGSKSLFGRYFLEERGWIDFLASVPLLLFNSGPELFALVTGTGAVLAFGSLLNILKVVKAIRIARVLRLLRVLKIFRRIKNTDSVMAQRHVARMATMVVTTLVVTLLLFAVVESLVESPDVDLLYQDSAVAILDYIDSENLADRASNAELSRFAGSLPMVLQVRQNGAIRYDATEGVSALAPSDYGYVQSGDVELYLDLRHVNVSEASVNLRYFFLIITLVLMLMFLYSPHFALTISDPIHVMRKGFDESGYNLEVRIPEEFRNDEIYRLAYSYNRNYLPLKDRENAANTSSVLDLSMDDLQGIAGFDDDLEMDLGDDLDMDLSDSIDLNDDADDDNTIGSKSDGGFGDGLDLESDSVFDAEISDDLQESDFPEDLDLSAPDFGEEEFSSMPDIDMEAPEDEFTELDESLSSDEDGGFDLDSVESAEPENDGPADSPESDGDFTLDDVDLDELDLEDFTFDDEDEEKA